MEYIGIIITALLASNFVLGPEPMGICPFLGVSKKTNSAVGMGLAVTLVMTLVSLITYPLYNLLVLWKIDYLYIIVFI
ncbi:MAG: Rnf-Nqr domain containing protein, partial [Clostridia bacterium]